MAKKSLLASDSELHKHMGQPGLYAHRGAEYFTPRRELLDGGLSPRFDILSCNDVILKNAPSADVRAYLSFSAAIDALGATEKTLLVPDEQNVTGDKTVPSNVCVLFLKGGYLNLSTGVTVTFNQRPEAGRFKIFKLTGTAEVAFGAGAAIDIYPEWWGTT